MDRGVGDGGGGGVEDGSLTRCCLREFAAEGVSFILRLVVANHAHERVGSEGDAQRAPGRAFFFAATIALVANGFMSPIATAGWPGRVNEPAI